MLLVAGVRASTIDLAYQASFTRVSAPSSLRPLLRESQTRLISRAHRPRALKISFSLRVTTPRAQEPIARLFSTSISRKQDASTIYALSTAPGRAAIAVIRVSGPACREIYNKLCPGVRFPQARKAAFRRIHDPLEPHQVLDSGAIVLYFPAPATVTGEDVLELQVHGGPAIVRSILSAIPRATSSLSHLTGSVRYAEPGEFTRRAFMNDRLSLTQIEALGDTLSAVTEEQRRLSVQGTTSGLAERYERWRNMLLEARGELEALIDFSEDQHFDESPAKLAANVAHQVQALVKKLAVHQANAVRGELLRNGISIALIGSPNVGKSSLLNQVVGRNAAIVSAEAGTTRDVVEVGVDIGGFYCRLGDTAGIRQGSRESKEIGVNIGEVELEGIARAKERAASADLVVLMLSVEAVADAQGHAISIDHEVLESARGLLSMGKSMVVVINKVDRYGDQTQMMIDKLHHAVTSLFPSLPSGRIFCVSCHEAAISSEATGGVPLKRKDQDLPRKRAPGSFDGMVIATTYRQDATHASDVRQGTSVADSKEQEASPAPSAVETPADPGNLQGLLAGLTATFRDMTTALTGASTSASSAISNDDFNDVDDTSAWQESLGATERQRVLLEACEAHLRDFLAVVRPPAVRSRALLHETSDTDDLDIVAAAESLRSAADCLSKITGRGEQGDVEEVLGVVFEK